MKTTNNELNRHYRSTRFLNKEAELLDGGELMSWLECLTRDVTYQVPIRQTRERDAESVFSDDSFHYNDDYSSLKTRIERLNKPHSWSNNPPPRTRRFVSNIRVKDVRGDEMDVHSNLLLHRGKADTIGTETISAERRDCLREVNGELKLASREVFLDATILGTEDLMSFL